MISKASCLLAYLFDFGFGPLGTSWASALNFLSIEEEEEEAGDKDDLEKVVVVCLGFKFMVCTCCWFREKNHMRVDALPMSMRKTWTISLKSEEDDGDEQTLNYQKWSGIDQGLDITREEQQLVTLLSFCKLV